MNQADLKQLVSRLRVRVDPKPWKPRRNPEGSPGRLDKLRKLVTAVVKFERVESTYYYALESRVYCERLISDAIRYGDTDSKMMDMADYWLEEKNLVHKLFKVLVPRYRDYSVSYTRLLKLPESYPDRFLDKAVLELRGNPFPPLVPNHSNNRNLLHNVLLDAARKDFRREQYEIIAQKMTSSQESDNPTLIGNTPQQSSAQ